MENNSLITNWQSFLKEVRTHFGPTIYDDPCGCLSKFLQTSTVEDYHKSFEHLLSRAIGIEEDLILSLFLSGLKMEIQ